MSDRREAFRARLSLVLLVPAPTLGVLCSMIWWPGAAAGTVVFALSKIWILALPLVWHLVVDRRRLSLSPAKRGGFAVAALLGLAISAIIALAYSLVLRGLLDPDFVQKTVQGVGLSRPILYVGAAVYWITINSALEEYVWRWFVVQQFERAGSRRWAVLLSALAFTVHHVVAMQAYFQWSVVVIAATGIFVGGATWSWCYQRYRSIWPGYVSHALVDATVFGIGYALVFG